MLINANSLIYKQDGIPAQIAAQLDPSFPLDSVSLSSTIVGTGVNGSAGSADAAASAATRRDAIIGVCAAFGIILLAVVLWWAYKSYKRKQEKQHRRMTYTSGAMQQAGGYGATAYQQPPQHAGYNDAGSPVYAVGGFSSGVPQDDPFDDPRGSTELERRRSFFYAEDSLRGYSVPREEEPGITYTQMMRQQQGLDPKRRAPIQASAISAPILRESSLNW